MEETYFQLKPITFLNRRVSILLQNENGPCPLLAICNVLLLRNAISIHEDIPSVSLETLLRLVANPLLENNQLGSDRSSFEVANSQQALNDAIGMLPRLQHGLDVNVQFCSPSGVTGFEFTQEFAPFDLLDITLAHGWLVDPQDTKSVAGLATMTYNHVVELQFAYRAAQDRAAGLAGGAGGGEAGTAGTAGNAAAAEDKAASAEASEGGIEAGGAAEAAVGEKKGAEVGGAGAEPKEGSAEDAAAKAKAEAEAEAKLLEKGAAVEEFMNATASQLTYYGLLQLHQHLKDRQLCVFFRNNHFSTMFKFEGKLYLLATDLGYLDEPSVVWERLDEVDGDTEYVNSDFGFRNNQSIAQSAMPVAQAEHAPQPSVAQSQQPANLVDPDYLMALQLDAANGSNRPNGSAPQPASAVPVVQPVPVPASQHSAGLPVVMATAADEPRHEQRWSAPTDNTSTDNMTDAQLAQLLQDQLDAEQQAAVAQSPPPGYGQTHAMQQRQQQQRRGSGGSGGGGGGGGGATDGSADDVWNHAENRPYTHEEMAYMRQQHAAYADSAARSRRASKKAESSSASSCTVS